jgi:hypothetical protein
MVHKFINVVFALIFVSACSSGGGIGMTESMAWHQTTPNKAKVAYFKEQCFEFGFKENTPEIKQCIQNQMNLSRSGASQGMAKALSKVSDDYNDNKVTNRLERLERINRQRNTDCIMNGGVPSGGMCL